MPGLYSQHNARVFLCKRRAASVSKGFSTHLHSSITVVTTLEGAYDLDTKRSCWFLSEDGEL